VTGSRPSAGCPWGPGGRARRRPARTGPRRRWRGEDPLLVLQRAAGERPEAAEALAGFLDANSLEPLRRYLRDSGLADEEADARAAAIDALVLGVSTRRRVLRSDLADPAQLEEWLATAIQRLADGT
jgi:hypothetical protein